MRRIIFIFLAILICSMPKFALSTTYYVDATNGNDDNDGMSSETPWKTISKVNSASFSAGDSILFKRNETWRERLSVPGSGSNGNPITFGVYSTGNDPIINGADVITRWTIHSGDIWQVTLTTQPYSVFFDEMQGKNESTIGALDAAREWHWESNVLYVYSTSDPDNVYKKRGIEAAQRTCIALSGGGGRDYIVIDGLQLKYANEHCINGDNSPINLVVRNCVMTKPRRDGIFNCAGTGFEAYNNTMVGGTDAIYYGRYGIYAYQTEGAQIFNNNISFFTAGVVLNSDETADITSGSIYQNTIHHIKELEAGNDAQGIELVGNGHHKVKNINVYRNRLYDCDGAGIGAFLTDNSYLYYNIIFNCCKTKHDRIGIQEGGVSLWVNSDGNDICNNVIFDCEDGIQLAGDIDDTNIQNNIISENDRFGIYASAGDGGVSQETNDHNCVYNSAVANFQGSNQGNYDLTANPLMTDPAKGDFSLQSFSPCIDAGTNVGLTQDYYGRLVPNGVSYDIGACEYYGDDGPLQAWTSASPTSGTAPLKVIFSGSATGGILPYSYNWNFGDGTSSSVQYPSHTYSSAGDYTITLTVLDSNSVSANSSTSILVGSKSGFSLAIFSETGSPSPGSGGTTIPSPGNYSYAVGSDIKVKSIPNTNYRFSKWGGDALAATMFNNITTLKMDNNKILTVTFCTKCADVNGDLKLTPADAQTAFDIFLGKISNPTWCEKENANVNSSGSKLDPTVTPADAQLIFEEYLGKAEIPGDCSGNSRSDFDSAGVLGSTSTSLSISSFTAALGDDIYVPIIVESSPKISAFGFDVLFSSEVLTFIRLERTELTSEFDQLAANLMLPDQRTINEVPHHKILRVGGYATRPTQNLSKGVLVILVFRVVGINESPNPILIGTAYDDIQNAMINNGKIVLRHSTQENSRRADKGVQRKSGRNR